MTIGLFFILLAVLLAIALPVGGVFGLMAVLPNLMGTIKFAPVDVVRAMFSGMNSFTLLAVPLFMVSGMIMAEGGLSKRLFDFFAYFIGNKRAGFPCAVVVTCMFYAAISGSSPATVSAVGAMTIPFLTNLGYDIVFATAIVTVAGGLGVIIPPSISYIVYAAAASASPSALFIAGIIPGVLIGVSLMVYCWIYCKRNGEDREKLLKNYQEIRSKGFLPLLKESFWALLTPVIILGCVYSGICSPTEAAVIGVVYAFIIGTFVYRELKPGKMLTSLIDAILINGSTIYMVGITTCLGRVLTLKQIPAKLADFLTGISSSPVVIMALITILLLIVGCFMDNISSTIILAPILLPTVLECGLSPVQFGVVMTALLAIGFITPPYGINLFVASQISGVPLMRIAKRAVPLMLAMLVATILVMFIPALTFGL